MALGADMTSELWPLGGVNSKISYSKGFLIAKWSSLYFNIKNLNSSKVITVVVRIFMNKSLVRALFNLICQVVG